MQTSLQNVSIVMPVLNETWSLENTVKMIILENKGRIKEIIIPIHLNKTIPESLYTIEKIE